MPRKLTARIFEFENALEFGNFFETFLCRFLGRLTKMTQVLSILLSLELILNDFWGCVLKLLFTRQPLKTWCQTNVKL
jgi:hypothetical protein